MKDNTFQQLPQTGLVKDNTFQQLPQTGLVKNNIFQQLPQAVVERCYFSQAPAAGGGFSLAEQMIEQK